MAEWYSSSAKADTWDTQVLYVSGEEHLAQISARAHRLGVTSDRISLVTESDFDSIVATIERSSARIVIIDSLSVLSSSSIEGSPGSVSQIRIMTEMCMNTDLTRHEGWIDRGTEVTRTSRWCRAFSRVSPHGEL
jgi:predicted ATP-dependent serine protease